MMPWKRKGPPEPAYGNRVMVGQFVVYGKDQSERMNFDRSKYIPGNGSEHRLDKSKERK